MFQSRMFPREKRFRLGSPCTAVMEGAFPQGGQSAYGERMEKKTTNQRGSEKWKQDLWKFKEVNHVIGMVVVVAVCTFMCVLRAGSGSWVRRDSRVSGG